MARRTSRFPPTWNMSDLIEHLGRIPAQRIRVFPAPGTATEKDVIEIQAREDRLYELVDGVLVEKAKGFRESLLAVLLIRRIGDFAERHDLGIVAGPDGTVRLARGLVRIPDCAFFDWHRLPGKMIPAEPIPDLAPDLAIEVLSESNTKGEMERKLKDYFFAGVRLVWLVDPKTRGRNRPSATVPRRRRPHRRRGHGEDR
ncbi:MAG TPA: Uma2 family endonuclease, partial [Gemmataceae bacterium]|nr:Uma2 family endonuclease [Gemmataceae bacterium]